MADLSTLGRYQLRRVLGRGAMGVVYEGYDPNLSRLVAVKTILKDAAADPDTERAYAARFTLEAKAVARLNHPNIVQVYDFGVEGGVAYLVMEFIQGRELRGYFDAGEKFAPAEVIRIMGELLDALHFAHEAGVIHRDVKPANVMLDAQRRAKLTDFGVARVQDGAQRSMADTMVGTPAFMSPEQVSGRRVDRRTDLFSAGTILYRFLTGEQPFKGDGAWTVARMIMQEDPPQPSSIVTNVTPEYDAIVAKALAKDPAQRYASAKEFADELRGLLGGVAPALAMALPRSASGAQAHASDAEVEFWRAIQNSADPHELDFYLKRFPDGTYSELARHKAAKLRESMPDDDATVAIGDARPGGRKAPYAMPAAVAALVIAAAIGAYFMNGPAKTPEPVAKAPVIAKVEPLKTEISTAEVDRIRKDAEERVRREYSDKSAAEQAAAAKAAADKAVQDKQLALKAALEKAAAEKSVMEKAAANRDLASRTASDRLAAERAAAEKAAAEKVAAEKAAAEKAVAAKAVVATKPGWPGVGDRWVYDVRQGPPDLRYAATVEVVAVTPSSVQEVFRPAGGTPVTSIHRPGARMVGIAPGITLFAPYARAFQELRGGEKWSGFDLQQLGPCMHAQADCSASATVVGKERVTVRAGSFDAWHVIVSVRATPVDSARLASGMSRGEYSYWYAEDAKRIVKYQSRGSSIAWPDPNVDMELVSYTPAGTK